MSSRKLTADEKKLNFYLTQTGIGAFTAYEYDKYSANDEKDEKEKHPIFGLHLNKLMKMFNSKDIKEAIDFSLLITTVLEKMREEVKNHDDVLDAPLGDEKNAIAEATAELFGLTNMPLSKEVAHSDFFHIVNFGFVSKDKYDCSFEEDPSISEKINTWVEYCKQLDSIKPFLTKRYPRWNKADAKTKAGYIEELQTLSNQLEEAHVTSSLVPVLRYLNDYRGLNALTTAKAIKLLDLNLPNINTLTIARKIVRNTNLFILK